MGASGGWLRALAGALPLAAALASCGGSAPDALPSPTPAPAETAMAAATPAAARSATPAPTPVATPAPAVTLDDARALLRAGLFAEAADAFASVAATASDAALLSAARLGESAAAREAGDAERALALARLALAAAPAGSNEETRAAYLLGLRLNEAGRFAEAADVLRPHAVLGGGHALALHAAAEYARALAGSGDGAGAARAWDALLALPDLGEALRLAILRQRAELARETGDLEGRARWLGQLAALTGEAAALHELASAAFLLGDLALFGEQLRAVMERWPGSEEALQAIADLRDAGFDVDAGAEGYVYYRHRAYAEARAALAAGLAEPGLPDGERAFRAYFLAAAYDDGGFPAESVPLYDEVAANPDAGVFAHRARYWAARAMEALGEHEEAARRHEAVAGDGGQFSAESAFRAGFARLRAGDAAAAIAVWETLSAHGARARYWTGRAHEALGDMDAARAVWRLAAAEFPRSFHGIEARRALGERVDLDGRARPLPAPPPDGDALDAWLAAVAPGGPEPAVPEEAAELALAGLPALADEALALAAARASSPRELLALARAASDAGLPGRASVIAEALRARLGLAPRELPDALARLLYPLPYAALLEAHARAGGLDPLLLAALIQQESRWDADAVSIAGAMGLTQVIPPTADAIAAELGAAGFAVDDLFRPAVAIRFGAFYLGAQLERFGDVHHALAAYNGGPGNAARWAEAAGWPPADFVEAVAFSETRAYVQLVMEHYAWYRALYGGAGG